MMSTGIVRRMDIFGRVPIPKELRRNVFGKQDTDGEPVEIFTAKDGDDVVLIIKPYKGAE